MKKRLFVLGLLFFGLGLNAQIINFPDINFKNKLLAANTSNSIAQDYQNGYMRIDANQDGEIQVSEAQSVFKLSINNANISNLQGIQSFTNLWYLNCEHNSITSIDILNSNPTITNLVCNYNSLTEVHLSGLPLLYSFSAIYNQITNITFANLPNIKYIDCGNNPLPSLAVGNLPALTQLNVSFSSALTSVNLYNLNALKYLLLSSCNLSALDTSGCPMLKNLSCAYNHLVSLDLSANPLLESLTCYMNQLTVLDLSSLTHLTVLQAYGNNFAYLFLKNGFHWAPFNNVTGYLLSPTPGFQYICTDDFNIAIMQNYLSSLPNLTINSYCSFVPGGSFYKVQGVAKFDLDANGCDVMDDNFTDIKYTINDGTFSATVFPDTSGNYLLPALQGTHTVTPIIENPAYFTIEPPMVSVAFPATTSPVIQDFCIAPNGNHNDLEVALIPLSLAIPGFDATYKIIYKNKGTASQSGALHFAFDDAVMDLVSSNPAVSGQGLNDFNWNFTNLKPFESREISLNFNLNSPTDVPQLVGGSILNFNASITGLTDETPDDNVAVLTQVVVNSFDPNDKTCLEGTMITPEMVGKYVHYKIRFENTGTANAQNIVVRDIIDTAKFDVSSLVPLDGSHLFQTKISSTNKVEFIFENINLPFDDANNDGYVAFKIKTKPNLVVGNTFSNNASIYFDYNAPIITNTATTTIALLPQQDFEFGHLFVVSPNPIKDQLHLTYSDKIIVSALKIYNTLGQLVLVVAHPNQSIDLGSLKTGTYLIQVVSNLGTSSTQFVKK